MDETRREYWANYLMLASSVIPSMIVTGFMPKWNVLPFGVWLAIATVGGGLAGVIATPRWGRGMLSGLISGAGVFVGTWLYAAARAGIGNAPQFWRYELVIGAIIGWAPGFFLYSTWARPKS